MFAATKRYYRYQPLQFCSTINDKNAAISFNIQVSKPFKSSKPTKKELLSSFDVTLFQMSTRTFKAIKSFKIT